MSHKISIFYDGMQVDKCAPLKWIDGVTTNCSLFSTHTLKNYSAFWEMHKHSLQGKQVSFQIWEEETAKAIEQIQNIHAIDSSIFVKIPVVNTSGKYNTELFEYAIQHKIPINVTCVYTLEQIDFAYDLLKSYDVPVLLSVFAGPISDLGIDPAPYVTYAVHRFRANKNVQVLWAGCREPYTIDRAQQMGCHIITVPDGVIEKLHSTKTLEQLSIERVSKFYRDATTGGIQIR